MSAQLPRANNGVSNEAGASPIALLHEAAVQHMRAGRQRAAQLCCRRILELDAGHVDTLQLMGLLSLQARQEGVVDRMRAELLTLVESDRSSHL